MRIDLSALLITGGASRRLCTIVGALLLSAALPATRSSAAPSLRDLLSPEEFQRAGLGKLSENELAFLSERVVLVTNSSLRPAAAPLSPELPHGEAAFGREEQVQRAVEKVQQVPDEIRGRIAGAFAGWSGQTTFTLSNGQVWQQAEPGNFVVQLSSPTVIIRKGRFGTFFLGVEGFGSRIKVKRLK